MPILMKRLFPLFIFLLIAPGAVAQNVVPKVNANFILGIPVGEFSDNVDNIGFGLNVSGGVGIVGLPFMVGADLGYMIYGFERRSEPFSTTIPDVTVDVETTNNIVLGHLFFRIQPQQGVFQPYLEGLFGFKYLFTSTSIENISNGDDIASSTNFDDFASSYGVGAGFEIMVSARENENGRLRTILIHAGVKYLLGSTAEYLERGSITRLNNGTIEFDISRSRTDLVLPQLGVTFTF